MGRGQSTIPISHAIYLIRHGDVAISPEVCYGQLDCAVNDKTFADESLRLIRFFNEKIAADSSVKLLTSPLKRCHTLAKSLHEHASFSSELVTIDAFKEIYFGEWEGQNWDSVKRSELEKWNNNFATYSFPKGESPSEFNRRVIDGWQQLLLDLDSSAHPKTIVIVSHAGVLRSILAHFLQIPFAHSLSLKIDKLSVSHINYVPEYKSLSRCINFNLPLS